MAEVTSEKLFFDLGSRYDAIVIGEKHYAADNEKLYNDPGFYRGLAGAGYGALAIELPIELQPMIDAYYNGNKEYFGLDANAPLTPQAMLRDMQPFAPASSTYSLSDVTAQLATQIQMARANGIKVIAIDDRSYADRITPTVLEQQIAFVKDLLDAKGINEERLRAELGDIGPVSPYFIVALNDLSRSQYLTPQEQAGFREFTLLAGSAERMKMDQGWTDIIKNALPAGTKVAAIVGLDHPANIIPEAGIDELLGGDAKVATIILTANENVYAADRARLGVYGGGGTQPASDAPHAVIYADTMTMKAGGKMDAAGYSPAEDTQIQSMIEFTPQFVRESRLPLVDPVSGRMIINTTVYNGLDDAGKKSYRDEMAKIIDSLPGFSRKEKEEIKNEIENHFDKESAMFGNEKYKFLNINENTAVLLRLFVDSDRLPSGHKDVYMDFLTWHELGHGLKLDKKGNGLGEAGADFYAAALTYLDNPGAGAALQAIADNRALAGLLGMAQEFKGSSHSAASDTVAAMAILAALSMADMEKFRAMPLDQRREALLAEALKFDATVKGFEKEKLGAPHEHVRRAFQARVVLEYRQVNQKALEDIHEKLKTETDPKERAVLESQAENLEKFLKAKTVPELTPLMLADGATRDAVLRKVLETMANDFAPGSREAEIMKLYLEAYRRQNAEGPYPGPQGRLDVENLRASKIPHLEQGGHLIVMDIQGYRGLNASEKTAYGDFLVRTINHLEDFPPDYKRDARNYVSEVLKSVDEGRHGPTNTNIFNYGLAIVSYDHATLGKKRYETFFNFVEDEKLPANAFKIADVFQLFHEYGHARGMSHPAADHLGAIEALLKYGDAARPALQIIADDRALRAVLGGHDPKVNYDYGYESANAVKDALNLSRDRLERIGALDDAQKLALASVYDKQARATTGQPEEKLANAFAGRARGRMLMDLSEKMDVAVDPAEVTELARQYASLKEGVYANNVSFLVDKFTDIMQKRRDVYEIGIDLLNNDCPFKPGETEYKILQDFVDAARRAMENRYNEDPAVAPEARPAAAPLQTYKASV